MFILEKSEQNQHQLKINAKRKNKSMKALISTKYRLTRTPSKQFNDPIYAGFDINQQNKQSVQWGPWITNSDSPIKNSFSLHTTLKKGKIQELTNNTITLKKNLFTNPGLIIPRSTSKNQLPEIKQVVKSTQKKRRKEEYMDIKIIEKKVDLKFNPKVKHTKYENNSQHRPLEYNKNRIRLGTVVYNYCTSYNVDDCILNYHRKSEPVLEKITKKQDQMLNKLDGLKSYWMRKNQNIGSKLE